MRCKRYILITALACFLILTLQSCKTDCADDYEMKVVNEIFYDLIEISGAMDLLIPPPQQPSSYSDTPEFIAENQRLKDRIEKVNNGKITAIIAVEDSLFAAYKYASFDDIKYSQHSAEFLEMEFSRQYMEAFEAMGNKEYTSRFFDLSKIENTGVFKLRYISEFPAEGEIWKRENYDFYLSGVIGISRIYFDTSRQFGIIYTYGQCSPLWGGGQIVFIRKIDNKWVIEKTIPLWIA